MPARIDSLEFMLKNGGPLLVVTTTVDGSETSTMRTPAPLLLLLSSSISARVAMCPMNVELIPGGPIIRDLFLFTLLTELSICDDGTGPGTRGAILLFIMLWR